MTQQPLHRWSRARTQASTSATSTLGVLRDRPGDPLLREARLRGDDTLRKLIVHLEEAVSYPNVREAVRAFLRARSYRIIRTECAALREGLPTLVVRAPNASEQRDLQESLGRLAALAREARERSLAGRAAEGDDPDLEPGEAQLLADRAADALEALEIYRRVRELEHAMPRPRRDRFTADHVAAAADLYERVARRRRNLVESLEGVAALRVGIGVDAS